MLWIFLVVALWFLFTRAIWLHSLRITLQKQRRMRMEMRLGDASQMVQLGTRRSDNSELNRGELDGNELETLTGELQKLGFERLGDIITRMDMSGELPGETSRPPIAAPIAAPFASPEQSGTPDNSVETETDGVGRIFGHPRLGCYASLISVVATSHFPPAMNRADLVNVAPFRTVILSLSGTRDDSWSFATHNREVQVFSLLLRHPRKLSHRLIGATPAQLLESHLAERDEIASQGDFRWDKATSIEKYQQFEAAAVRFIRSVYERATVAGVTWLFLTYRFSRHELWRGELAPRRR